MLGLTVGALAVFLRPSAWPDATLAKSMGRCAALFAVSMAGVILAHSLLFIPNPSVDFWPMAWTFLSAAVPFAFSGIFVCLALTRFPEERTKWWADYEAMAPTGVEEIVRWASPVIYMRRTLTEDCELSGVKMAAGDKATLWYCSANRDEDKFADPWTFDVGRTPNPHAGFGGGGAHFCLGANLARREISVAFEELRRQMPDIQATEEPARLLSPFIHGIKRLPVSWTTPS